MGDEGREGIVAARLCSVWLCHSLACLQPTIRSLMLVDGACMLVEGQMHKSSGSNHYNSHHPVGCLEWHVFS